MAIINRVPRTLLPLLDAKTLGNTPKQIADVVSPILDLSEMYAADIPYAVAENFSTGQPALGSLIAPVTVPAGETWLVYAVSNRFVATGNQTVVLGISFDTSSDNSAVVHLSRVSAAQFGGYTIGQSDIATWQPARPWIVSAGSSFESLVLSGTFAGVDVTIRTTVLHRRLSA